MQPRRLEPLVVDRNERIVVVAPHPDDDVLGCGAFVGAARAVDVPVDVVFLTDGEASHPSIDAVSARDLASIRVRESLDALAVLGVAATHAHHLHLPDGTLERLPPDAHRTAAEAIACIVDDARATLALVPWRRDPHPDHRAGSALARTALTRARRDARLRRLEYVVWLDERGDAADFPNAREACERPFSYRAALASRKHRAIMAHRSQTVGLDVRRDDPGFLIDAAMIARACDGIERYYDVFEAA